jgi:hypothetical protein
MQAVWNDPEKTETSIRSMVGLLGYVNYCDSGLCISHVIISNDTIHEYSDLAEAFPSGQIRMFLLQDWVAAVLKEARTNREMPPGTKEVTRWAKAVSYTCLPCLIFGL